MMLTTKGRYAVMAMADLAYNTNENKPIALQDIAARQSIALNYLEQLAARLRRAGLLKSVRGPGGGYLLARTPSEIAIADIIDAVDESIKMTRCDKNTPGGCVSAQGKCLTHGLWKGLNGVIQDYFQSISLQDLCDQGQTSIPSHYEEECAS